MARIFLIRHGEPSAPWHEADDPGLSARGRLQAEAAAAALAELSLAQLITSPLARCRETAAPLAQRLGAAPAIEPAVAEITTPTGVADRQAWLNRTFFAAGAPALWSALDAPLVGFRDRVHAAICALKEDTAVFTHFVAINAIVGRATGREETFVCRPAFASITELACEHGALRLVSLGAQVSDAPT